MTSITVQELHARLLADEDICLIDVRESFEHEAFDIGGKLIPLNSLLAHINDIDPERTTIFYCRKGVRSQIAIQRLMQKQPFNNLINLTGGLEAWIHAGLPPR